MAAPPRLGCRHPVQPLAPISLGDRAVVTLIFYRHNHYEFELLAREARFFDRPYWV